MYLLRVVVVRTATPETRRLDTLSLRAGGGQRTKWST